MEPIHYYPLVDRDSEGTEKFPMFPTDDEDAVRNGGGLYLAEIVPKYYRLWQGKKPCEISGKFTVHCPACGKAMRIVADVRDKNHLALYTCPECNF